MPEKAMKPSEGALTAFARAVKAEKGIILPAVCKGRFLTRHNVTTCECGNLTRAALPYDEGKTCVFCAVCDRGFDFPRIRKAS